ncbi:FRG domain-containing protein [Psychrobacter sp. DAB_AL43B]|uniref:FRG domain-containing protein n=1 Tax=Psychrobacter sp. DAB_AL43B TaxID=1028416 RepID=UPI0009A5C97A|nr:FRG domain-containing protein [Psychrobacter sp. DAB_AL43B]SLJ83767.1 hypothetical protein DABAL43B_0558 [Psychrobacter sp. DAB_AL43B]
MYNLIVIGYEDESWFENGVVEITTTRFLEYTKTSVIERFKNNPKNIYQYPCLIMKEGDNPDIYLCKISNVERNGKYYKVSFNIFDDSYFKYSDIESLIVELDIRQLELTRTHWALKDSYLVEILLSPVSNLSEKNKKIIKDYSDTFIQRIEIKESIISPFGFLDIKIDYDNRSKSVESVTDFIQKIFSHKNDKNFTNFYRGHSSSKYKLEPSLFRKKIDGSFHFLENENTIYNELLTQNYSEFGTDNSTFDRLVRMQHFSLPTRLLDISTNPLIALYFACKGGEGLSGDVVFIQVPRDKIKYFDSDTATCIANLCKLTNKDKEILSGGVTEPNYTVVMEKLYNYIKDDKPYFQERMKESSINEILCIKGKITNLRINAQSGAFLMFGLDAELTDGKDFGFNIIHYLIKAKDKEKLLES